MFHQSGHRRAEWIIERQIIVADGLQQVHDRLVRRDEATDTGGAHRAKPPSLSIREERETHVCREDIAHHRPDILEFDRQPRRQSAVADDLGDPFGAEVLHRNEMAEGDGRALFVRPKGRAALTQPLNKRQSYLKAMPPDGVTST